MTDRRYFLGTLSAAQADNWQICKQHGLWGSGTSSHAQHAARQVGRGDVLFVWQSGAGLLAAAELLGDAQPVRNKSVVPWPNPEKYQHLYPIEVLTEAAEPVADRFPDNRSERFGIQTHQLQSGFIRIEEDQAVKLAEALGLDLDSRTDDTRGSSTAVDQSPVTPELPRPAGAVYLRPATSVVDAMLGLWRRAQAGADPGGLLLVVGNEDQRAEYEAEITQPPFADLADQFRFTTPAELAAELEVHLRKPL